LIRAFARPLVLRYTTRLMFKFLIFDLDETLYPRDAGLMQAIGARINRYLIERLKLSEEDAQTLRQRYFQQYGTALRGLIVERPNTNTEDYLEFVHDIPLTKYIGPNPALNEMLRSIDLPKVIFTNAMIEHAQKVLAILGIADRFSRLIDIRAIDFISKPDRRAYEKMLALIDAQPDECILVEDSARNLLPAKALGLKTILVDSSECDEVDYCVKDILGVKDAVEKCIMHNS
jgi:putative hydrolase of the HAD superfamily